MLVNAKYNELKALQVTGRIYLIFFLYGTLIGALNHFFHFQDYYPSISSMTILGSGVGIFLAFRINSGYMRWWEAASAWGGIVQNSHRFGAIVNMLMLNSSFNQISDAEKLLQKQLIFNLIGYVNALRLHLRLQGPEDWEREIWNRQINGVHLFSTDEADALRGKSNIPSQILVLIHKKISDFFGSKLFFDHYHPNNVDKDGRQIFFGFVLGVFHDMQGKCERIKSTTFPWGYGYYTHRLVWIFGFLIPLGLISDLQWPNILICAFLSTVFVTVEQVGRNLDTPFESSFNDTPMSALCREIEIDLLEQMEEGPTPESLKPISGILM